MKARTLAARTLGALAVTFCVAASADQVTILTSFPKEITDAYKKAYEKKYPETKIEVLNKGTTAAIAFLRETPAGQRPDVFWASAPDAFEVLAAEKMLTKLDGISKLGIPEKIGPYPVNDPEGYYRGQALSGYGIMWNTRYMKAHKLPLPKEWVDLTRSVYFGHLAVSSPSRSGTTHLTVETILQGEGWDKGWEQLLMIGGNAAAVTERSFGVPEGVNNGQYGIGLVIDFFGLSAKYSGYPVEFVYPSVTAIVPANIGAIEGSKNLAGARKFIAYSLSEEGQKLLLDPKISRLPVLPGVYNTSNVPRDFPNVYQIAKKAKVLFDSQVSQERYGLVSAFFDHTITFRLKELQQAAGAIAKAETRLAKKPNPEAVSLLREARRVAFSPVLTAERAKDKALLKLFSQKKGDVELGKKLAELEEHWGSQSRANYAQGTELAEKALTLIR